MKQKALTLEIAELKTLLKRINLAINMEQTAIYIYEGLSDSTMDLLIHGYTGDSLNDLTQAPSYLTLLELAMYVEFVIAGETAISKKVAAI